MKVCVITYKNKQLLNEYFFIKTFMCDNSWLGYLVINRKSSIRPEIIAKADYYVESENIVFNENFLFVIKHIFSNRFIQRPHVIVANSFFNGRYPIFRPYNTCTEYRKTRHINKLRCIVPCFFRWDAFELIKNNKSTIEYLYINILCANTKIDAATLATSLWFMVGSMWRKLKWS